VGDCKLVVQNIVYGMKTLLFSILYCTRMVGAVGCAVRCWGVWVCTA
jgi:hypothetical protein